MIATSRADDFEAWVEQLADPVRGRRAYWHLVLRSVPALPAVRRGLRHANADVRMFCTKALDRLADSESYEELVAMLDDPDARVRLDALHALACDRCKDGDCRPAKERESRDADPDPAVRKKSGWYAPGGAIHRRTAPRAQRLAREG